MRKFNRLVVAVSLAVGFASLIACTAPVTPSDDQSPVSVLDYRAPARLNTTLTAAITATQSPISILDSAGWAINDVAFIEAPDCEEYAIVTDVNGNQLSLERDELMACAHSAGAAIYECPSYAC